MLIGTTSDMQSTEKPNSWHTNMTACCGVRRGADISLEAYVCMMCCCVACVVVLHVACVVVLHVAMHVVLCVLCCVVAVPIVNHKYGSQRM